MIVRVSYIFFFSFLLILTCYNSVPAQIPGQSIRGSVVDRNTGVSLPGATILIESNGYSNGAVCNDDGIFSVSGVPVGRYSIEARFIGYEPWRIAEVLVSSARPLILEFRLQELVSTIEEVEVKAQARKDIPLNQMATLSARTFTVEETRRYAGGFDDPGRMAASFAGVAGGSPNDNSLSIRGNAPKGLAWRVEGVSVPNPNHFAGMLVEGGGIVSLLSAQMLNNSDFYTGAFPAEYGNALSGVFDMNLRAGNNEKRGWGLQVGTLGAEAFGEGAFVKGKKSSYLFNYRYATTALLKDLIPEGQLPIYQDLAFKLYFPAGKAGIFSVWALGGIDQNGSEPLADSTQWQSTWDQTKYTWNGKIAMGGLNHKIILSGNSSINTSATAAFNQFIDQQDLLVPGAGFTEYFHVKNRTAMLSFRSVLTHRFSSKLSNRSGLEAGRTNYDIQTRAADEDEPGMPVKDYSSGTGVTGYMQGFSQFRWSPGQRLTMTGGANSMIFFLNNSIILEPRFGIDYKFLNGNSISAAYGNHSQIEPLPAYFYQIEINPGVFNQPNLSLPLTRTHHYVLSYKRLLAKELRMNLEAYYQHLYKVPVSPNGYYSMINFKKEYLISDSLVSQGTGTNMGVDLCIEKFLYRNYYFLITGSLFDSKYRGGDGIIRNTRWDYGYVANFLGGAEFFLGEQKTRILGINVRTVFQGGERTHPVDEKESVIEQDVVYDYSKAWESRFPNTFFIDFTITFRINKPGYASVWGIQIKNLLLEKSIYEHVYNSENQTVEVLGEGFIFPNISYKIEF